MRKVLLIATISVTALTSNGSANKFPPNSQHKNRLPAYEAFAAAPGTLVKNLEHWFAAGEVAAQVQEGSLRPSDPAVAANLLPGTGGHLLVRSAGSSADIGWSLGNAVEDEQSPIYYSFLIRAQSIPYNGPIAGLRRHNNGAGAAFQLRGDLGNAQGGTNTAQSTGLILRPASTDSPFPNGEQTLSRDGRTVHLVVVKAERSGSALEMTTWLDPDPALGEAGSEPWLTAQEQGDATKIRWFSLAAHNKMTDFAIDEIRVGSSWADAVPVMEGAASAGPVAVTEVQPAEKPSVDPAASPGKINWVVYNPLAAQQDLRASGAILLYFRSNEARNCRVFEQNYLMTETAAQYLGGSTVYFVNMDSPGEVDLPPNVGVLRVPTFIRLHDRDGITHSLSFSDQTTPREVLDFLEELPTP